MSEPETIAQQRADYYATVKGIAQDAAEIKGRDERSEHIEEAVESALTYTREAYKCIMYTDNDDAIFDAGMTLDGLDSTAAVITRIAFFAMRADVQKAIDELRADEEEEEGEDYDADMPGDDELIDEE
jgi:hypothetical protein